jgi:hypothetical protein
MSKDTSLIDFFPFSSYLDSNYTPSDEEVVQIKTFLIQPRKQPEEMKAEIDRLQAELSSVKSKYDSLYPQFNSCASLITLPRRVPDDVLEEIFHQSLPTDRNALLDNKAAPLIFTRICRQWRQVAFASPRLWSTIHIHVLPNLPRPHDKWWNSPSINTLSDDPPPPKQEELRAAAASEWLKRSGDLPLHISLIAYHGPLSIDPYLSSLVPFSSRWKSLVLEGQLSPFSRIFTLGTAYLRTLELLILDFDIFGYGNIGSQSQELISSLSSCGLLTSPSLCKLSIQGRITMFPTILGIPWGQLTHLELNAPSGDWDNAMAMSMSTASGILQVSTSLVSCRIKIIGWADFVDIHSMQLPLLRHLWIVIGGNILPFTDRLEVPGLQEINLHIIEPENDVDYKTCLAPLFRPQQGRIQKLITDARYLDHESFLEILRKCPDLISLTVKDFQHASLPQETPLITIDDEFLEKISSNDGEVLCPQLEEFICDYPAAFSTTGMIEFIKRKQGSNIPELAKLKKVALPYNPLEEKCLLLDDLRPYISQGLVLHFDTPGISNSFDNGAYGNSAAHYANFGEL